MGMADYQDPTIAALAQHFARLKQYGQPLQAAPATPADGGLGMPQQALSPMSQWLGAARQGMPQGTQLGLDVGGAGNTAQGVRSGLDWIPQVFYNRQF